MATCWLIDDGAAGARSSAVRFARLRGVELVRCRDLDALPGRIRGGAMIAIGAPRLRGLPDCHQRRLAGLVGEGAALYVRGAPRPGAPLELAPFAPLRVAVASERRAVGYRFTASPMLPAALRGDEVAGVFEMPGAAPLPPPAQPLLMVRHVDGGERAAVFALEYGGGRVIYDLHSESETGPEAPILARLARPELRHCEIGALAAADHAAQIKPARLPPFNLTIDDRPANFDHFNAAPLRALLRHVEELHPGAHTDFAWTPSHTRAARGYVETVRNFSTGFVWHGLRRHVDHRALSDPAAELAQGRRLARRIERRFGVRLQPVMIFPFERSTPAQLELLGRSGFIASVEEPRHPVRPGDPAGSGHLACERASRAGGPPGLTVLHRYPAAALTRDRMLAMAALGLPIIAYAHPEDIGLRRFSRFFDRGGEVSHFDEVLRFAASKALRPRSLEDIAAEIAAARGLDGAGVRDCG